MNDDIKEILDKLEIVARKHTIEVCDDGSKIETMPASIVEELRLNNWSAKLLLDYITNLQHTEDLYNQLLKDYDELQQENEKLKNIISSVKEDFLNANNELTNLQQKLEEYKDTETYSKRFLYKANKDRLNANLELVKELEGYKSCCEKVVEYIKEHTTSFGDVFIPASESWYLSDILNGGSDE